MYHLRQVFITIGVVTTMYVASRYSGELIVNLMRPDTDGVILACRIWDFVLSMVAGMLLMKMLTWRLRLAAILILPALLPFFSAAVAWRSATAHIFEMPYAEMLWIVRWMFLHVAGMLTGGLLAHFLLKERKS
jgi:hypothetical protein